MKKVQVFISSDDFLLNQEANNLIKSLQIDPFNIIRYNFLDANPLEIINELETVSLLGDLKAVVLTNPDFLFSGFKNQDYLNAFEKYLLADDMPSYFIILSNKQLESNHICNILKSAADIKEIAEISSDKLANWIIEKALADEYKIDLDSANELIARCDLDMMLISTELEKLKSYKHDSKVIEYNDVCLMVSKVLDDDIYELLSAFISGNKEKVMSIYGDMMALNEDETRIINAIENKLEEILYVKEMVRQGYSKDEIANQFRIKPGRAYYMMKDAKLISDMKLLGLIEKITDLEFQFKSGKIDKKTGLELFLLGA